MSTVERKRVISLEKQLLLPAVRADRASLNKLLSEDFFEFGKDGKKYTKAFVLKHLPGETDRRLIPSQWRATSISSTAILVTYCLEDFNKGTHARSRRSSVWVKKGKTWKIIFHQATAIA